ncbi:MAG: hypothetical protein II954_00030 [Synergistaceae bacterium]|nr:hypothetical protein [Synergistaceae bacterium]
MAEFERRLRKILLEYGCFFVRHGRGDHDIWHSPIVNRNFVVDGEITSRHSANGVLKEAGIPYRFR